jgi:hypothetical protein
LSVVSSLPGQYSQVVKVIWWCLATVARHIYSVHSCCLFIWSEIKYNRTGKKHSSTAVHVIKPCTIAQP